jgi:hypothetical protein
MKFASFGPAKQWMADICNALCVFRGSDKVKKGTLALSSIQRRVTMLSLNEPVLVEAYVPTSPVIYLETLKLDVDFLSKGTPPHSFFLSSFSHPRLQLPTEQVK